MNEGNSRGVNVDLNMLNKPGTFLSAHALALYNWLKSPQGLDDPQSTRTLDRPLAIKGGRFRKTMFLGPVVRAHRGGIPPNLCQSDGGRAPVLVV